MIRGHPACCSQGGPRPVIGIAVETRREAKKKNAKQAKQAKKKKTREEEDEEEEHE